MKEAVWIAAGVLGLCALVSFFWYQNNGLSVTRYRLKGMRVTRPMKIVHLSDLHSKRFGRDNEKLFALVADCSPDLIAITGDLIDDSDRDFCRTVRIVGRLCGLAPVVCIPGNHEHRSRDYLSILEAIRQERAVLLQNEQVSLTVAGTPVTVLGLGQVPLPGLFGAVSRPVQRAGAAPGPLPLPGELRHDRGQGLLPVRL